MSHRPGLVPVGAVVVGLALLIVLGAAAGGALLVPRGTAAERSGAAGTPPADVPGLNAPVSPFPALAPPGTTGPSPPGQTGPGRAKGETPTPPRLIAIARGSVRQPALDRIAALRHVRKVVLADGGAVRFSSARLNLLAVDPAEFRLWAPKAVAGQPEVWNALERGELVAESKTAARYLLRLGGEYEAGSGSRLRVAASAPFGLPGVDGLVGRDTGRALGLIPGVAVLVNTPAGTQAAVVPPVKRLLGAGAQVVVIGRAGRTSSGTPVPPRASRPAVVAARRPGTYQVGRPGTYLDLYKIAAQRVCPGLSWTVLAAIGQVESGHGRNNGPSSAGALGPMQFMPATWKAFGVDGDGDGKADIWSPYDAVPSAARYLCANGAGLGGAKLRSAVFRYNHSWDYVNKVLGIAGAYAHAYP